MFKFFILLSVCTSFVLASSIDKLSFYKAFQSDKKATMESNLKLEAENVQTQIKT